MEIILKIEVPKLDNPHLPKLLQLVNGSHEPLHVSCQPEPSAIAGDCFNVVAQKVQKSGGRLIFGWQLWLTDHLIEAEAHAVWESPEEELFDLTPKGFAIDNILFVEDDTREYDGKQIDNIRLNITKNSLVEDLIKVCKAIYAFDNRGLRADVHDLSDLLNETQISHKIFLLQQRDIINSILMDKGTKNTLCKCNSGLAYKNCHGKDLLIKLYRIK